MTFYKTRGFGGHDSGTEYHTQQINPGKLLSHTDYLQAGFHNRNMYASIRRDGVHLPEPLAQQIGPPPACTPDPQRHWLFRALSWLWASLEGRN